MKHSAGEYVREGAWVHWTGCGTLFAGMPKGVGKVLHSRRCWTASAATCALGSIRRRWPVTAVQILNNHVLPFFEQHDMNVETILSDNGREYCGREDRHPYERFLQLEDIEHRKTKAVRSPTTSSNAFTARSWTSTSG